jgi:carbamoyl-phosphate synthase large subunit
MASRAGDGACTVLVTGVGAPPGVSIFKAFRRSALRPRIVATDAEALSVGLFRADVAYTLPRVAEDEAAYLRGLERIVAREGVRLVCPGSEIELVRLSAHAESVQRRTGARVVANAPRVLAELMDKWTLTSALRARDLPAPDTALGSDPEATRALLSRHGFPVIVKPRHGSGSRHLHVVQDSGTLELLLRLVPEPIVQEYLHPDHEEYSVGIYRSPRLGYVGQIAFRRTLSAGLTYRAEVVRDADIEGVCRRLVDAFQLWGPINVQLRKTAGGVRIFEVNPRFSSSAVMRAAFGFNEAELCLRDLVLGEAVSAPLVRPGVALRFWDEVYLSPEERDRMREGAPEGVRSTMGTRGQDF